MARFWTSYTGRNSKVNEGEIKPGDSAHTRGRNAGASVTPRNRWKQDEFDVYMTRGSNGDMMSPNVLLGTVHDTPDGPRWKPAEAPGRIPAYADQKPVIMAIPARSHENNPDPGEYFCVVHAGSWPSGEPRFGTARMCRNENGNWSVTEHSDYWDHPMSQTEAATEVVRLAGHERPAESASA